jgi:hypothetical protein
MEDQTGHRHSQDNLVQERPNGRADRT